MIFAREISDPLTGLVKKVNSAVLEFGRGIDAYVIFCSDDASLEEKLKKVVEKEQILTCAVSLTKASGVPGYKFPREVDVAVMFFVKQSAQAVFTFKTEELTAK